MDKCEFYIAFDCTFPLSHLSNLNLGFISNKKNDDKHEFFSERDRFNRTHNDVSANGTHFHLFKRKTD